MAVAMTSATPGSAVRRQRMLIGGEWVDSLDGGFITVEDPARREPIAEAPRGTARDVDRAVRVAYSAFERWRTEAEERDGQPGDPRSLGLHSGLRPWLLLWVGCVSVSLDERN